VHLLLFGGATAYNSYWDKDTGPVGGLRNPPPMRRWMWFASVVLQWVGFALAISQGTAFATIYGVSMGFFWLYSSPHFRWKGTPLRSLLAIGISTGTNSLLMGYLAAGKAGITAEVWTAAFGVALIILSLYPVSQLFQLDEDRKRGDQTFAITFGFPGVIRFFKVAFTGGSLLVGFTLAGFNRWVGAAFIIIGLGTGWWVYYQLKKLTAETGDYQKVMRIKYATSLAFVSFLLGFMVYRHLL
jgi:1,4-dihydroxy-2-naphthoate octaprenyltransferase